VVCRRFEDLRTMIGIDISHTASHVMVKRLRDVCTCRKAQPETWCLRALLPQFDYARVR
jgi:hypothetical protein